MSRAATTTCPMCRTIVYGDGVHSCFDADLLLVVKDAARYRWLKSQLGMDWDLGDPVYLSLSLTVGLPTHVNVSDDLDATIDAALAVQP